tara:strand:- start:607 stop:1008 length:402 start_codon:yes stop_codon:yes gene_type:complete
MKKNYLAKIIAKDPEGLQLISACCFKAKIKIREIKFLRKNKVFLVLLERFNHEKNENNQKINSICKFEFVDNVKSKNINQNSQDLALELLAINYLKNRDNFEITLLFVNNAFITLSTEIIEVTLEDQNIKKND